MENQIKEHQEFIDELKIVKTLGIGYTAEVKLGINSQGKYFAIKQYKLQKFPLQTINNQLKVMKQLQHNNIIQIIGVRENATYKKGVQNSNCFAVILQFAEEGELFDYLLETGKFNQNLTRTFFKQLISGLSYVHQKGFSHRDLKLQNLLLSTQFVLKIKDFGFSCSLKGSDGFGILKTRVGTEGYMAPQIFTHQYDGKKIDIFSAGVILFTIHAGNPPFQKATKNDPHYKLIKEKRFVLFWHAHSKRRSPGFFSQSFKNLIQNMLAFQPKERISMEQIQNHLWVKGQTQSPEKIIQQFIERKKRLMIQRDLRKKKLSQQKKRRNQNIHNQGYNTRDNQTIQDKQFLTIYNKQKVTPLKLEQFQFSSKEDLCVKPADLLYAISSLKYFLSKHKIILYEQEQCQQIITQSPQEWICNSITSTQNKIEIKYTINHNLNNENIISELIMVVALGKKGSEILLRFQKVIGDEFYYRKLVSDIKNECFA